MHFTEHLEGTDGNCQQFTSSMLTVSNSSSAHVCFSLSGICNGLAGHLHLAASVPLRWGYLDTVMGCGIHLAGSPTHPLFINRLYVPTSYSDADALTKNFSPLCGSSEPVTCLNGIPAAPVSRSHQFNIFVKSREM